MDKALNDLYQNLQKLIGLHRQLLENVRQEKLALLEMNTKEIQLCTFDKEAILYSLHQAEMERQKKVAEIAVYLKVPYEELTIQKLSQAIQGNDLKFADQLRSASNTLSLLLERIREQNSENRRLVEQSLIHVREMKKNVLGESQRTSQTYGAKGQTVAPTSESRLIKGEA